MLLFFVFATEQERDKFEYIFVKYKKLMLYKAYGILQDYMLAEDAANEAFIRVYKNLHKIGDPDDAKSIAFIVTIIKNVSLTMLQQEKSHVVEEFDEEQHDTFNLEGHILSQLNTEYIYRMLDQMGEEMRDIFLLKYTYDLSHKEISRILGISENNVTVRLHRVKKKLAVILREGGGAYV